MKPLRTGSFRLVLFVFHILIIIAVFAPHICRGQSVVINEVMAENANVLANLNDFPDWIELYNSSASAVSVSNWYIRAIEDKGQTGTTTNLFRFPTNAVMPPFERLIIWCDNKTNSPGYHTKFALPKTGVALDLLNELGAVIAGTGISFGFQIQDLSIGRIPDGPGGIWNLNVPTPGSNNVVYPQYGSPSDIKINEWAATNNLANGSTPDDWLEVYNTSTNPVFMTGLVIADNVTDARFATKFKSFTNLCFIAGEEFIRLWCDDHPKPTDHLNLSLGSTSGGDTVRIFAPDRFTILEEITFLGNAVVSNYWIPNQSRGRLPDGGPIYTNLFLKQTPNESNFQLMTNIVVNEVLSHTDPPLEDAIELYNTTDEDLDIGYWWISNKKNTPKQFQIPPGTRILARNYIVFYEYLGVTNQLPKPGFNTSGEKEPGDFTLNSAHGDEVWIFSGNSLGELTGLRGSMQFDSMDNGVSVGPVPNSVGKKEVTPLVRRTFGHDNPINVDDFRRGTGGPNSGPRFGPIVISEIYYHPPDIIRSGTNIDNSQHEFVEVYNTATTPVQMFDPVNYGYADGRTNVWHLRGGVEEDFPTNFVMAPGQIVLFVNFAMTNTTALNDFRNRFHVPDTIAMFGPYSGKLDNSKAIVEIKRPDVPQGLLHTNEVGFVPYIQEDRVQYDDDPPWPSQADGATNIFDPSGIHIGFSLQRVVVEQWGDDPINWVAANPTPGRQPLKIETVTRTETNSILIRFRAWAGSGYSLLQSSTVDGSNWVKVADVPPQATSGIRQVVDPNTSPTITRFYKLATPIQP